MAAESFISSCSSLGQRSAAKEVSYKICIIIANCKYKQAGTFLLGKLCYSQEQSFLSSLLTQASEEKRLAIFKAKKKKLRFSSLYACFE